MSENNTAPAAWPTIPATSWELTEVRKMNEALTAENIEFRKQIAELIAENERQTLLANERLIQTSNLQRSLENTQANLRSYKRDVGDTLKEYFEEIGDAFDDEAVIFIFKNLDIEDYLPVREWTVKVSVTATAYVTVEAANEEEALNKANDLDNDDVMTEISSYDIEWESEEAELA